MNIDFADANQDAELLQQQAKEESQMMAEELKNDNPLSKYIEQSYDQVQSDSEGEKDDEDQPAPQNQEEFKGYQVN